MQTFDLDKLMKLVDNKFHLILGIVERVQLLKRGVEAKVPRRNRDLITVALEEFHKDLLSFEIRDGITGELVAEHASARPAEVDPAEARAEALAAQNRALGLPCFDGKSLATPTGRIVDDEDIGPEVFTADDDEDEEDEDAGDDA